MQKIQKSGLFIFCNKGHGSNILEYCIKNNQKVIGVCSGDKIKINYFNQILVLFGLLLRKFNLRPPGGFVFSSPYENSKSVKILDHLF